MAAPRKTQKKATADLSATASTIDASRYRSAATSEAVVPELTTDTEAAPLPRLEGKAPFVLTWHVAQWIVLAEMLVPSLSPRRLQPGVSGVVKDRNGKLRISRFKTHVEERGWRMVPYSWAPGGKTYMRKTKVDPSGTGQVIRYRHHTQWETLFAGTSRIGSDEAGYATWCKSLVDNGRIPPCPLVAAYGLREEAEVRKERLQRQVAQGVTSNERDLVKVEAELKVINDYIKKTEDDAVAAESEDVDFALEGVA